MKKIMMVLALLSLTAVSRADQSKSDTDERIDKAGEVLRQIMAAPDRGIPQEVLDHAKCVAVVPHMVKGGFVFGAEGGRGVASCRTATGWSAPAFFAITGGSWGLQIGVEGVDLVMIIQGDRGMQHLLSSKFQLGGDASAAAGPVGRHASADTDWKLNTEILTYSRAKGVFAGLTLTGADVARRRRLDARLLRPGGYDPRGPARRSSSPALRSSFPGRNSRREGRGCIPLNSHQRLTERTGAPERIDQSRVLFV